VVRVSSRPWWTADDLQRRQWRFPFLPPGKYVLTVEVLPRFKTHQQEAISIGAGETLDVTVVLKVAGVAESITVQANADIVPRTSGIDARFGPDFIRLVPTRRYSMFSLANNTPGVSPTSPSSGSINTMSGSTHERNAFLDGTN
jgi:hypothetical protein